MTTALSLITSALREGNLIPVGTTPTSAEQTEGLERLNSLITSTFGTLMGEGLSDWVVPQPQRTASVAANYPQLPLAQNAPASITRYPPNNSRLIWGGVTGTIYFPEAPNDGSRMALVQGSGLGSGGASDAILTLNGNGRLIGGAGTATVLNPAPATQWFYRADTGNWLVVADMALTSSCPFPPELDDLWICLLAMRLAPRYGKTTAPETVNTMKDMKRVFRTRYQQHQVSTYKGEEIPQSMQGFGSAYGWFA